jgi:hypothetical protein
MSGDPGKLLSSTKKVSRFLRSLQQLEQSDEKEFRASRTRFFRI